MINISAFLCVSVSHDGCPKGPMCGGSLITTWHVLTAAHCVLGQDQQDDYRMKMMFDFLMEHPWYTRQA